MADPNEPNIPAAESWTAKRLRRVRRLKKKVPILLPFEIRCNTCDVYMAKGANLRARRESVVQHLVIRISVNCKNCAAEIAIKTDPKNSGFVVEGSARRILWTSDSSIVPFPENIFNE